MSKPSIKKNFIYNIFYQVLAIIVPLITSPYLARVLGAEKIGINTWTYSVVFYFMIFATLGVNNYGNRSIAYIRDDKNELSRKFWSIYSCQAFASTMVIFIYIIYLVCFANKYKSKVYIRNTMIYTILLGSAFVFGMAAVAETFSVIFWGEDFVTSGRLIAVMAPAILFSVFGNVIRTQYLIPRSKDKEYTISLLVGAIINFSINYMLIPKMGAMGASVATVISEFSMTFLQSFYVRKSLDIKNYLLDNYMFIVIGFIMFGVVKVIGNYLSVSIGTLLVMIISGALVYVCLIAILLKMSRKENIQLIRKLVCEQRYRHLKR